MLKQIDELLLLVICCRCSWLLLLRVLFYFKHLQETGQRSTASVRHKTVIKYLTFGGPSVVADKE